MFDHPRRRPDTPVQTQAVRLISIEDASVWNAVIRGAGGSFTRLATDTTETATTAAKLYAQTEASARGRKNLHHDIGLLAVQFQARTDPSLGSGGNFLAEITLPPDVSITQIEQQVAERQSLTA